jgi:multidrug efflux pump subunit AcrA (membrane-fusion protein)
VPVGAVVEDQGVHYVFVQDEDGEFQRREVTLGGSDGVRVPVTKGLQPGEVIVVEGAVHVKLAGVAAVPAGHTHNH